MVPHGKSRHTACGGHTKNADGRTDRNRGWKIGLTQNNEVLIRETEHKNITKYSRDRRQNQIAGYSRDRLTQNDKVFNRLDTEQSLRLKRYCTERTQQEQEDIRETGHRITPHGTLEIFERLDTIKDVYLVTARKQETLD